MVRKATLPRAIEKRVWSRPTFTPRYFGFEVLRFFAEPPALVDAIIQTYDGRIVTMSIADIRERCNAALTGLSAVPKDVLIVGIIALSACASFGLGYVAGRDAAGRGSAISLMIAPADTGETGSPIGAEAKAEGQYVASKNGTKYYLPSCAGAKRISEANKIWFNSIAAAAAAR